MLQFVMTISEYALCRFITRMFQCFDPRTTDASLTASQTPVPQPIKCMNHILVIFGIDEPSTVTVPNRDINIKQPFNPSSLGIFQSTWMQTQANCNGIAALSPRIRIWGGQIERTSQDQHDDPRRRVDIRDISRSHRHTYKNILTHLKTRAF